MPCQRESAGLTCLWGTGTADLRPVLYPEGRRSEAGTAPRAADLRPVLYPEGRRSEAGAARLGQADLWPTPRAEGDWIEH